MSPGAGNPCHDDKGKFCSEGGAPNVTRSERGRGDRADVKSKTAPSFGQSPGATSSVAPPLASRGAGLGVAPSLAKNEFDVRAGNQRLSDHWERQVAGDPELERAIRTYLDGDHFKEINARLREGEEDPTAKRLFEAASSFQELNNAVGGDGVVYRGVTSGKAAGLLKSDETTELGVLSTSLSAQEAANFATQRKNATSVVMRITPSPGLKARLMSPGQAEVAFPPGTKLRVTQRHGAVTFSGDYGERKVQIIDVVASR